MAMSTSKRLLLMAFLLLCFFSLTAQARRLRENGNGADHEKSHSANVIKPSQGGQKVDTTTTNDDFVTMDYTPAKKNPPIHN